MNASRSLRCRSVAAAALLALASAPALFLAGCQKSADAAKARLTKLQQSFTPEDFVKAAGLGDLELVGLFLQAGMNRDAQDARGYTALMQAAELGRKDVVKALLQERAKTEVVTKDGSTALILAAGADQADCVRLLIDANADVTAKNSKNWTALIKAVYHGHARTTEALLKTSRDALSKDGQLTRALMVAAVLGATDTVRPLLDAGAPINVAIERKQTALMLAAQAGKRETVQLLLQRGADPLLLNADNCTAAILALQKGHSEVGKLIDTYAANSPAPSARSAALAGPGVPPPAPPTDSDKPAAPAAPAPATLAAAPTATKPGGVPAPQPTPDASATATRETQAARLEETLLREKKVDPRTLLAVDTGQDSDGDGWTDAEEIAYGTNPNDPDSHPPLHTKLRMVKLDAQPFPVIFEGVERGRASVTIQHGQLSERHFLTTGQRVPGEQWKIAAMRAKSTLDKSGSNVDTSELTLVNTETGEKLVLVKSMPTSAPGTTAVLSLEGFDREVSVKAKQQFQLDDRDKTRYTVVDIRPTQVVLRVNGTGEVVTVSMRETAAGKKR